MSKITFAPLKKSDFPLMLKWLESKHVKAWWDQDISYNLALIKEKYSSYTQGYKIENGIRKSMQAYIINLEQKPIGYIQLYNAYDFAYDNKLNNLPGSLCAFDVFIGDAQYLGKNIGSTAIVEFFKNFGCEYEYIFISVDKDNIAAIKSYQKAGFKKLATQENFNEIYLLRKR